MRGALHWFGMLLMLVVVSFAAPATAVNPDEMLDDPALEARARDLSKILRCVVCRNQNIDDSNAKLAKDFRILLRERLLAGDSDEEAIDWLVSRYGSYILLKPPVTLFTILLWVGPLLLLVAAFGGFWIALRKRPEPVDAIPEFSKADREIIADVLNGEVTK